MLRRALVLLPLALLACSSKDEGSQPTTASFAARFEIPGSGKPTFLQVPFPSDLHLNADGTIAVDQAGMERLVPRPAGATYIIDSLAHTRGFGVYGGAMFEILGDAPDDTKLPRGAAGDCTGKDSPTYFVDLDAGKVLECRARWSDDNILNPRMETTPALVVTTARGVVLPERHRIAVLLTSGVVNKKGVPLAASPSFAAIRDGERGDAARRSYGDAIDQAVAKIGIDKSKVVSAAVYTTGPVTEELRDAREAARATAVPTLKWGSADVAPVTNARFTSVTPLPAGWNASLDDMLGTSNKLPSGEDDPDYGSTNKGIAHDALGAIGVAAFDAPNLLIESAGGYGDPTHGTFHHEGGKVAINPKKPTNKVWVSFFLPKAAAPAGGYPAVVFQHGLAGQRGDAFQIANSLAKRGFATVAIEPYLQGTRGLDAGARGDDKADYKRETAKYEGPDGFSDRNSEGSNFAPTDLFGNLFRLAALRDQFRQSVIDHTTLLRVLKSSPSLDGLELAGVIPKIDGSKVAYMGDSLGGILGSMLAGIEPDHAAYILNVPGGALLTELAANSPNIYSLLNGSAALNFGFRNVEMPPWHPLVQLMQHVIDGGDPVAVAPTAISPIPIAGVTPKARNLIILEALGDETVSNHGTEALARAMGVPLLKPHGTTLTTLTTVDGPSARDVPKMGSTAVLVHLYPAQHGIDLFGKSGHRIYAKDRPIFGDPSGDPFPKLAKQIDFENPYLEAQTMVLDFITQAFDGKVPTVNWSKAPAPMNE